MDSAKADIYLGLHTYSHTKTTAYEEI